MGRRLIGFRFIVTIFFVVTTVLACSPAPNPTPTAMPTPTERPAIPRNDNVEALNSAQAAMSEIDFGFAPLLVEDGAKVILKNEMTGELARLTYPEQPADPTKWKTVDSFVSAYGTRFVLKTMPHVSRIALGSFGVPASVGSEAETIEHFATWITFSDRSRAVVDLTPLSTNFAARHTPDSMITEDIQIESMFADRRTGVNLNQWQPMAVVEQDNQLYYVLARVTVTFDDYTFALRIHPVKPADPMEPMQIRPGIIASVKVSRAEFAEFQAKLAQSAPSYFRDQPETLTIEGSPNQALTTVLDQNAELIWHLITKFEHQEPNPNMPTPTPSPSPTPSPTPTPTLTPTPRSLPLETS